MAKVLPLVSSIWMILSLSLVSELSFGEITFERAEISVEGHKIKVELADTEERRRQGLMFRKVLGESEGMLFIFEQEETLAFWMKNTLIPLSIGFFDSKARLINSLEMVPQTLMTKELPRYQSAAPAQFALEMPKAWFKKMGIKPGAKLILLSKTQSKLAQSLLAHPKAGP